MLISKWGSDRPDCDRFLFFYGLSVMEVEQSTEIPGMDDHINHIPIDPHDEAVKTTRIVLCDNPV